MIGQQIEGFLNLSVYIILSAIATIYVSPFQVDGTDSYWGMFFKVAPLAFLAYCMSRQHDHLSNAKSKGKYFAERAKLILWCKWAFVFSAVGDFFMFRTQNPTWFMMGMFSFSIGHLCFIHAFGFKNINRNLGITLFVVAAVVIVIIIKEAPEPLRSSIPFYACFLITTVWRAIDRASHDDGRTSINRLLLPLGIVIFLVSDAAIGFSNFVLDPSLRYKGEYFVMATYYTAQGLIAIAVT